MKLVVDMNLPPGWIGFFRGHGIDAVHWIEVGDPRATDAAIMAWARAHGRVVFTHDLDFSALLAATRASGPSVLQVRTQDVFPTGIGDEVLHALRSHGDALLRGAIVTVDGVASRVRILPL